MILLSVRLFSGGVENVKAPRRWQIYRFAHDHHRCRIGGRRHCGKTRGGGKDFIGNNTGRVIKKFAAEIQPNFSWLGDNCLRTNIVPIH